MNRYSVRISVIEHKPAGGPAGVFGSRVPDKLLDASVTVNDLDQIRDIVDGLIYEGIPATQREDEKYPDPVQALMDAGASGVVRTAKMGGLLPPTVEESGDLAVSGRMVVTPVPDEQQLRGGKHSGNCSCSACEPILPGEIATIQVPPSFVTQSHDQTVTDNP